MVRKIYPVVSVSISTNAFIGAGSRLLKINGECSTKPTYDFVVQVDGYTSTAAVATYSCKFCGSKNGQERRLEKLFPLQSTTTASPAVEGSTRVTIVAGTGVTLQVYVWSGTVAST